MMAEAKVVKINVELRFLHKISDFVVMLPLEHKLMFRQNKLSLHEFTRILELFSRTFRLESEFC